MPKAATDKVEKKTGEKKKKAAKDPNRPKR
jgi:hypothetical protein